MASTMSLRLVSVALDICLTSASGTLRAAKERWLVIETLSGVRGAVCSALGNSKVRLPVLSDTGISTFEMALAVAGIDWISFTYCCTALLSAAVASSAMPSCDESGRRVARGALTGAGVSEMSNSALATATPAWPSIAAWCILL